MTFEFIAWVKYRDVVGGWHPIGKVGASAEDEQGNVEASIYLDAFFLGRCFAFPFEGKPFPYLHGEVRGFDGHYKDKGVTLAKWIKCGYIWSHEVDGTDVRGLERVGQKAYGLRLDALPLKLNKRGAIVLSIFNE